MSKRLAISTTLSVLMMSAFVLFAPQAAHEPLGQGLGDLSITAPALPKAAILVPAPR